MEGGGKVILFFAVISKCGTGLSAHIYIYRERERGRLCGYIKVLKMFRAPSPVSMFQPCPASGKRGGCCAKRKIEKVAVAMQSSTSMGLDKSVRFLCCCCAGCSYGPARFVRIQVSS